MATVAVFFGGLVAGVAALIVLGGGKHGLAVPPAKADAKKPDPTKSRYHLTETTPIRTLVLTARRGEQVPVWASREVYPSGKSLYFIRIDGEYNLKITAKDIEALVKFNEKVKGKKKTDAKEVAKAIVHWKALDHRSGKEIRFSYSLENGFWGITAKGGLPVGYARFDKDFIPTLAAVLKDLEALKKVKPSVSW
jgi:hypothetical protein